MKRKNLLSLIIPCFKQEKTIYKDLKRIKKALGEIELDWEIIVVVDGPADKSYQRAKKLKSRKIRVFQLKENIGKGHALRWGMKKARGEYIAFLDAGMEIDPIGLKMLLLHVKWYEADIIVGSKRHLASKVNYPIERKILSLGYYWLVRILFGFKVRDTQAGIKIFRSKVLKKVLPVLLVKKYAIDVEMLAVAYRFGFKKIYEAPIRYEYQFSSLTTAANLYTIWMMFKDTMAVFYRLKILKYYDRPASRQASKQSR
jgi:glycosyltransferase involved in cell wall biosynthesis